MDHESRVPVEYGSDCGDSNSFSSESTYPQYDQELGDKSQDEVPGDYEHFTQGSQNGQSTMHSIAQEPPMVSDQVYLSRGYQGPVPNFPNMPTFMQSSPYDYLPEMPQPTGYVHSGYDAPTGSRMQQSFQHAHHLGPVPIAMFQNGLSNVSPTEQQFQPTAPWNLEPTEERRGSSSDDPEDDVPLMLRLQRRSTSCPSTGHHEAAADGDSPSDPPQPDNVDQASGSSHHEETESDFQPVVAPKGKGNAKVPAAANANPMKIDWKLDRFDATFQLDNEGWALAIVSVPGMVREYLFLAPDHPEDEFRLIQRVFLPSQQVRVDDIPKVALLNFHTMAVLVLDVVALRNSPFGPDEDAGHDIMVDPLTFDPDEVFLSASDNWRVGLACGRKNFEMIRGVQEFFDVAMDIVYFIKDNGLVPKKPRERKVRTDKGVKRGARMAPNELQPRKKPKTVPPPTPPPAPAKKSKTAKTAEKSKATNAKAPAKTAPKANKKTQVKANTKTKVTTGKVGRPSGKAARKTLPKGPKGHIKG
ncbi:hypothetical protein BDV96DRAFT_647868 [Lophiotrema nucula]|uniref:Uncharacterized protein n=1 Tax=Lophiotrema nucula TaxID=690887 RepID=A0A6A5Z5L3_9PLEO|nr:hypothetical protein BDV96DRAFT_647868 [Lophiotrema nucula]